MLNAIIIDDEPAARASLLLEIQLHCPEIKTVAEAGSVEEGIEAVLKHPEAGLLFLDIQLSDGSGFDLLNQVNFDHLKVIFTTAYSEYALRAIKFAPMDYLLKPIDAQELRNAVEKVMRSENAGLQRQIRQFVQQFAQHKPGARIALATADGIHIHQVKSIVRCASDGNYTTVFFEDRSKLLVAKTLKDLETMLSPYAFERIHKSHLINMDHLKRYFNRFSGEVEMSDGAVLPIAQRKKARLLALLGNLNDAGLQA